MAVVSVANKEDSASEQREEILAGLSADTPAIDPKYFYDEKGSELFALICDLPEYYPTRTETAILKRNSAEIAAAIGEVQSVVEPGAGACEKIRLLLPDLKPNLYIPTDISESFLKKASAELRADFPHIEVLPMADDFSQGFRLPPNSEAGKTLLFYPGSTIGNFTQERAKDFLKRCADELGPGGGMLIGVDLHKDSATLNAAYNDTQGVTAAFNLNMLSHINRLLDANFEAINFDHLAFYNEPERRIEMHLVSTKDQLIVHSSGELNFTEGQRIHTEYSFKYSREDFAQMAGQAGFANRGYWSDENNWFSVQYFEVSDVEQT